jgi:hypothetical protein
MEKHIDPAVEYFLFGGKSEQIKGKILVYTIVQKMTHGYI